MPRGGRRSASPSPRPSRNVPARSSPPPPPAPVQAQPRQPGLMGQMAATAGGVAIGSAVGHTVGAALTGGFGGRGEAPQEQAPVQQQEQQQQKNPCQMEFEAFVNCAQNQGDISLCQGFNAALKECKLQYGI